MKNQRGQSSEGVLITIGLLMIIIVLAALLFGWQWFKVFSQEQSGKARLAEARWSRQIAVEEAKAKLESEKLNASSEVERAKGVAEANKIIGDSLQDNDEYLRYLWITHVEGGQNKQVIYVPTEAGLPILESTRLAPAVTTK